MLTRDAQPTSRSQSHTEGAFEHRFSLLKRLSAAGGVLLATIAILLTLVTPEGAAAASGGSSVTGTGAWPWPLLGEVITPYKNGSDRYAAGQHRGLDIAAPVGTPVRAIVGGRVSFAGTLPDGGVTVTVRSGEYLVSDLHLASRAVARGDSVVAGQTIGAVGTTGKRSAEQPHLHLSVRRASDRAYLDPMSMLGPQELPKSVPAASSPPAVAKSLAPSKQSRAPKVHVTPLERGGQSKVHAQANGDTEPAQSQKGLGHGASGRPTTADSSAGARAREGHAARHVSRVAPPPLKVPAAEPAKVAVAASVEPVAKQPTRVASQTSGGGPNRLLLLAVAAVCIVALAMRRKAAPTGHVAGPPQVDPSAATGEKANVIELHRAS
jgi:hypothetical protein